MQKMNSQNLVRYSSDQIDALKNGALHVKEFHLSDSKGVYDSHSIFFKIDGKAYFFSKILRSGFEVNLKDDYLDFLKYTEIPNYLANSISIFDEKNASTILDSLLKKYKLQISIDSREIPESDFAKLRENEKLFVPLLTLYLGEKMKSKLGGRWEIEVDHNFFFHVPVIRTADKTYYPGQIALDVFKRQMTDIGIMLNLYVASINK